MLTAMAMGAILELPVRGDEWSGPLEGWADAKRDFQAVGDGKADDSVALQKALDSLRDEKGQTRAVYLPAGVYRITRTLTLPRKGGREAIGLNIQGESPDTTSVVWDGPVDGVMFDYGAWYSKLGRITFDGRGKAKTAVRHGPEFVTANEMADMVFRDAGFGIEAGDPARAGIAETSVQRCRFLRCSKAGVSIQNFNSLDWWMWHCLFEDCRVGATNSYGAGNFHVYKSVFRRSTEADITIGNTGYFSFRHNTSVGSKAFFVAAGIGAGAQLTFQDNQIIDPADTQAIRVGNLGPVFLLDNTIASRGEVTEGPVAVGQNSHVISVGNTFTVAKPISFRTGSIAIADRTASREKLPLAIPTLPGTPPRLSRKVLAVRPGSDAAAIQAIIDAAAKLTGQRPIIHFAAGQYSINHTLTIPVGCDVQLVGEGIPYNTQLQWTGEGRGPIVRLAGPSRATLRDLVLVGSGKADALAIQQYDQPGGRVFFDQVQVDGAMEVGYLVNGAERAQVQLRDCGHGGNKIGVRVVGGPRLRQGQPTEGRVVILSGASSNNDLSYDISDGGRLLARDIWYETGSQPRFLHFTGHGEFTLHGSNVAHPRKRGEPGLEIDGFRGRVSFLGVCFTQVGGDEGIPALVVKGGDPQTKVLALGCHGNGEYFANQSSNARAARLDSVQYTPGGGAKPIADVGQGDDAFLTEMLAQTRELRFANREDVAAGLTDVRLHRVFVRNPMIGISLTPGQ
ncbi:MAG: glycosyl hydrolase family 28-related protein [Planctomycetota bacterium]|nr:glycosyl hydrolase family 28-related protein [Planctomycetota bacterium]